MKSLYIKIQFLPHRTVRLCYKDIQVKVYTEIIAVGCEIDTQTKVRLMGRGRLYK